MADHYVLYVELVLNEGAMDEFMPIVLENAANSRQEPKCLRFDVLRPHDTTDTIVLYEIYVDESGFDAHRETAHYKKFDAARKPLMKSAKRQTFSWSNPA
ncbi:MAG: putative quinol monooxygenase [Vulcanimicrobiaceae bacterium]